MIRHLIIGLLLIGSTWAEAQHLDTLRVMTYNLLNYRNVTSWCTSQNNDPALKESKLKIVHWYYRPHLLLCNEIGANPTSNYSLLLDNVLNTGGSTSYKAASFSNNHFSSLVNMLYYDSDKLVLHDQDAVTRDLGGSNLVRVIDVYTLYYNDPNLAITQDTVFITAIVGHLKAGSTTSDENDRADATEALMDYLKNNEIRGNVMIGGDFNIGSSNAPSYQNLVNESDPSYRFHDPIEKPGNWSGNVNFEINHTQSTRSSNTNGGCFSGGGLDDWFDHMLIQFPMTASSNSVSYIPGTYKALGNPGNAYNQELPTINNPSVPNAVAEALYEISDHLPVVMELQVRSQSVGIEKPVEWELAYPTLIHDHIPVQWTATGSERPVQMELLNLQGQRVASKSLVGLQGYTELPLTHLPNGLYILQFTGSKGAVQSDRIVKY